MDRAITVTPEVTMGAAAVLLAVLVVLLAVTLAGRRRLRRDLDAARAAVAGLTARVESLDAAPQPPAPQPPARTPRPDAEYVITTVGDAPVPAPDPQGGDLPAPLTAGRFVSVAVGESLVRVLSFGHGVRRALTAENRNRIAFEMRREVKRSRKQRRREVKEARRHLRAAERDTYSEDAA